MEVWSCGRVAVWWCGCVVWCVVWCCGRVVVWSCGHVVMWSCGRVVAWWCAGVLACAAGVLWRCGLVVVWCCGAGAVVVWLCGAMVWHAMVWQFNGVGSWCGSGVDNSSAVVMGWWCIVLCGTAMGSGHVDCRYGACGMWSGDYMVSVYFIRIFSMSGGPMLMLSEVV